VAHAATVGKHCILQVRQHPYLTDIPPCDVSLYTKSRKPKDIMQKQLIAMQ
jgi:hypothetical protein